MSEGYRERFTTIFWEWKNYLFLVVLLLLIPYSLLFSSLENQLTITGLFYIFNLQSLSINPYNSVSLISIVNLILVVTPSLYFTYRSKTRIEGESISILAIITFALTLVVLSIVDTFAFISPRQIDTYRSPTPNLQYLPGFSFLLLLFTVVVPTVGEYTSNFENKNQSRNHQDSGVRGWISSHIPRTSNGWMLSVLVLIPNVIIIESLAILDAGFHIELELFAPYYSLLIYTSSFSGLIFDIILGGIISFLNLTAFQILGLLFTFSVVLYVQERLSRKWLLVSGLLSIALPLILLLYTLFSSIFATNSDLYLPFPLLQIAGILVIRQAEKSKLPLLDEETGKYMDDTIRVPVGYILTSLVRRIKRGKKRDLLLDDSEDTKSIYSEEEPVS